MKIVYLIFILISIALVNGRELVGLEKLIKRTFIDEDYNKLVRPVSKKSRLTDVYTELKILQIDLDEKYQELISTVWIEMSWLDDRLVWDPNEFENITEITLPVENLWVPDLVLQNGVGKNDYLKEFKYFNPWISYNGVITWVPEIRLHTKCFMKIRNFPFDTQCCEILFYSWAHTAKQMKILQYDNKNFTNITHISHNTEWTIYHTCANNKTIQTSENLFWWVTNHVIYIKRQSIYHIYTIVLPCGVLSCLSVLLFLLPPDSGEKITLGVTILLAFFVNSLVVSNYTPEASSDLPIIGIYYLFNIGLVSISITLSVYVLKLHFRGHKIYPVPKRIKYFLRMGNEYSYKNKSKPNLFFVKNPKVDGFQDQGTKLEFLQNGTSKRYFNEQNSLFSERINKNSKKEKISRPCASSEKQINKFLNYEFKITQILKLFIKCTKLLERRDYKKKKFEKILSEWKEAARRLDNILFMMSLFTIIAVPIWFFGPYVVADKFKNVNKHDCSCIYS